MSKTIEDYTMREMRAIIPILEKQLSTEQQRTLYYKELLYSRTEQGKEIERLEKKLSEAVKLAEMVQDNSKMPHQHTDPQLRLYCLSERATEFLQNMSEKEGV